MTDAELRSELLIMKSEDEELHTELSKAGALSGHYVPSLQAVHEKNAARLREILSEHGWPHEERVGADGALRRMANRATRRRRSRPAKECSSSTTKGSCERPCADLACGVSG